MSKLCISLPPFAPDYSGAASALYTMGGLIVIHDASGCTGNYTGYDEPRWYDFPSHVFCSGLRHMDAILGNDDKFIKRIVEAAEDLHPRFIALLGSPVPMVIGTDFVGIAREIESLTHIPTLGLQTNGLHTYGRGIVMATEALFETFSPSPEKPEKDGLNLIGLIPSITFLWDKGSR